MDCPYLPPIVASVISKDCMTLATADEGEADYDDEDGLINPAGSVSTHRR
jgi:hypothetical protein